MNAVRRPTITIADLRMDMVARIAGGAALFILAAAFAISFFAIKWVADEMGIEPWILAWLFPLVIDLPSLIASALTVALHDRPFRVRFYAWSVLGIFILLSWACNAVHALSIVAEGNNRFVVLLGELTGSPSNAPWLVALVLVFAAIPPVGVVLGVHLWAYSLRHAMSADRRADDGTLVASARTKQAKPRRLRLLLASLKRSKTPEETNTTDQQTKPEKTDERSPERTETETTGRHAKTERPAEPEKTERSPERPAAEPERELEAWEVKARALFDDAVRSQADRPLAEQEKPSAAAIAREVNPPVNAQNFRKRVAAWWKEYQDNPASIAAAASDIPVDIAADNPAADSENPQVSEAPEPDKTPDETEAADDREALREELHIADPDDDDTPVDAEPVEDRQPATVA